MSFKALYERRQGLSPYLSRTELFKLAQEISGKGAMLICTDQLTPDVARGLYLSVENPAHMHHRYADGKNLIFYARGLLVNRCWTRMVIFKESMHLFDSPQESTNTEDSFEALLDEFAVKVPGKSPSLEMRSEVDALWMALSLFTPEENRAILAQKLANQDLTKYQVAEQLRMPEQYVPYLFGPHYKNTLQQLLAK